MKILSCICFFLTDLDFVRFYKSEVEEWICLCMVSIYAAQLKQILWLVLQLLVLYDFYLAVRLIQTCRAPLILFDFFLTTPVVSFIAPGFVEFLLTIAHLKAEPWQNT